MVPCEVASISPPQTEIEKCFRISLDLEITGAPSAQFTRRNAGPIQFEAHVVGAVVRSEPEVQHVLCGNNVAAFWEIGSTESADYVRSRRSSIVNLQPIESTFVRTLQVEFGERDCNRLKLKLKLNSRRITFNFEPLSTSEAFVRMSQAQCELCG